MKESTRFENAKRDFNQLVWYLGIEYLEITDVPYEEDEKIWNIRDMISEIQFELNKYFNPDMEQYAVLHGNGDEIDVQIAKNNVAAMRKFINKYKNHVDGLVCVREHCSKWDN
ncbi:MAG: hypothetical protein MJ170_02730 [Alphaproteobacteria bacterium]|nr:hypothetical protein [Alphaproteobacteria bacterium]